MNEGVPEQDRSTFLAIQMMDRHGIAVTPERLSVYLMYHQQPRSQLARMMDVYVSNVGFMTEERCDELYERFFVHGDHARLLFALSKDIQGLINDVDPNDDRSDFRGRLQGLESLIRQIRIAAEKATDNSKGDLQSLRRELVMAQNEAMMDGLSGLKNRKQFEKDFRASMARSMEEGKPLSLLMLDVDHFKSINDTYGHLTGDNVLRRLGEAIRLSIKGRDLAFRYGGEEFAILLPETDRNSAATLAEQLRIKVHEWCGARFRECDLQLNLTISLGVAEYYFGETADSLLGRADQALYLAKQRGRNQVVKAPDVDEKAKSQDPIHMMPGARSTVRH